MFGWGVREESERIKVFFGFNNVSALFRLVGLQKKVVIKKTKKGI